MGALRARRLGETKLRQHAHLVNVCPMLHDLAIGEAEYVHFRPRCSFARRFHTVKFAFHRPTRGDALRDQVAFPDGIFDFVGEIGERGDQRGHKLFGVFDRARYSRRHCVINAFGVRHLIEDAYVALAEFGWDAIGSPPILFG